MIKKAKSVALHESVINNVINSEYDALKQYQAKTEMRRAYMNRVRNLNFCICEIKIADQLRGFTQLVSFFVFATSPSTFKITSFKLLAIFCGCTARFVSDLVGNPEYRFCRVAANIIRRFITFIGDPNRKQTVSSNRRRASILELPQNRCVIFNIHYENMPM